MPSAETTNIFKTASTTYFTSSLFFPTSVKERIFTLYAFVRLADNYADAQPQDVVSFYHLCAGYRQCIKSGKIGDDFALAVQVKNVIENFVQLQKTVKLKQAWVDAFLKAMELDLYKSRYRTLAEVQLYMYGSAEVIGLMICACADIDTRAYPAARMLGRAMQYANFLRDIAEDIELGRQYIPDEVLHSYLYQLQRVSQHVLQSFLQVSAVGMNNGMQPQNKDLYFCLAEFVSQWRLPLPCIRGQFRPLHEVLL
jgi:phytoene synthase